MRDSGSCGIGSNPVGAIPSAKVPKKGHGVRDYQDAADDYALRLILDALSAETFRGRRAPARVQGRVAP